VFQNIRKDANNGSTYGGGNWASHFVKKILEEHVFAYF